ncbi:HxlR family transcriptional regulator [Sphaerisporangium melleum]|uniref:HxlR family transcriptional regulator n=1 Tax=Sphaerisporangium melleum TaxID=321316 RepID=A0A917VUL5_9ACTN|nr:HxlR family transcriptional regulator [Sphaerisporangium melleum]GII69655.1 HxlR family transcriptional regulator [Sphaerisporangium melleum]
MLDAECAIQRSLDVFEDPWMVLILREALLGATRFGDFQVNLGISTDLLTDRLASLVEAGVLERRPYSEPGKRSRYGYHPTQAGRDLSIVLAALRQWGEVHRPRQGTPYVEYRHAQTGEPLSVSFVDPSGRAVPREEVTVVTRPPS